ncbi:MAG: hypothetical protein Kow0073_11050 [Immundisolibacter sp.]
MDKTEFFADARPDSHDPLTGLRALEATNYASGPVSIFGFGRYGPLSHKRGFDPVGQAMGGLMSVTGEAGGRPLRAGTVIADDMAGWQAVIGPLAALHHRGRVRRAAPLLGAHNAEVLGGRRGLSEDELEDLKARKII